MQSFFGEVFEGALLVWLLAATICFGLSGTPLSPWVAGEDRRAADVFAPGSQGEQELFLEPSSAPLLARAAFPAVVSVIGDAPSARVSGTGFFISPRGFVVTSRHVVERADISYRIMTEDGTTHDVLEIWRSDSSDLALLETTAEHSPWLTVDYDASPRPGQGVVALGAGIARTVSPGNVVQKRQVVTISDDVSAKQKHQYDVVQINAVVRPGNSGGPLIDTSGNVIGVVFAFDPYAQSKGFALSAAAIGRVMDEYATI